MGRFQLLIAALAVVLIAGSDGRTFGQSSAAQNLTSSTDVSRIVTTAEIRKFDKKGKSFEVKLTFESGPANTPINNRPPQNQSTMPPMGGGRRGGGMGGRRGGGGFPPTVQNNKPKTTTLNIKVFASDSTLLKDGDADISFASLKNGERVTITGMHRGTGNDIQALEIARTTSGGN